MLSEEDQYCKDIGLTSLKEFSKVSEVPIDELKEWWQTKPNRFKCVARGCVAVKKDQELKFSLERR